GVDTTSDAPIGVNEGLRKILLQANRGKSTGDKLKSLLQIRPRHLAPAIPRNGEPRTGLSMGEHCELMAQRWAIPRDEQDQLAVASHQKLAASYAEGWHDDLLTPFRGLTRDQNLRADISIDKLGSLKPCFERSPRGTLTAANSTPLTDGASLVLLASEDWAKARGLQILAYWKDGEAAAVDFVGGQEGLLMAPAYAVPRLLARNKLSLQDFDYYEIHEAFAAQVLCTLKAWEDADYCQTRLGLSAALGAIERSKLNVKGSSLAAGHPFAATGGRIVANLAKLLSVAQEGRGLISICAAGGQGVTAILER
ncbi:acetyl-CoA C-acetyltransferase, partial [Pseudomonas sp.]|uniref:acetyl-CoA C-acetyltransferase n=1 Tax=Pseudomonas sp. TaxID=306 RepID=UPI00273278CD